MSRTNAKCTVMEEEAKEMEKPDLLEVFKTHGFFGGRKAGEVQDEGKSVEETDYFTAVDSLLSSVKPEPVDMGDEAIWRRFRSTKKCLERYQKAIKRADNLELSEDEGEDEAAAEEEAGEAAGDVLGIPVPTVSAEAEELLRGARTLHRQTAELRSFLKDLLLEEGEGGVVRAPNCPEMEESTVDKMMSSSRTIAENWEQLKGLEKEEFPVFFLPDNLKKSMDKCFGMLSGDKASDKQCSDEQSEQVEGAESGKMPE